MRSPASLLATAAVAASVLLPSAVSAFASTSPYFILSSGRGSSQNTPSDISAASSSTPISTSAFLTQAKSLIGHCDSDVYIIAHQPRIHASDFRAGGMGWVQRVLRGDGAGVRGEVVVPYVEGKDGNGRSDEVLVEEVKRVCNAEGLVVNFSEPMMHHYGDMGPKVFHVVFPEIEEGITRKQRIGEVQLTDNFLNALLNTSLPPSTKWVLIYTSTPPSTSSSSSSSTISHPSPPHYNHHSDELKRRSNDDTPTPPPEEFVPPTGGLFQRYVFFGPGIFMGYVAAFFLLLLTVVGLSGLTSLKISYGAYEKEMGPAAQKKQQ